MAEPPALLEENLIVWDLWQAEQTQLIVGGLGTVVGVSHGNLPWLMQRYGVSEDKQLDVYEKFQIIEAVFVKSCRKDERV